MKNYRNLLLTLSLLAPAAHATLATPVQVDCRDKNQRRVLEFTFLQTPQFAKPVHINEILELMNAKPKRSTSTPIVGARIFTKTPWKVVERQMDFVTGVGVDPTCSPFTVDRSRCAPIVVPVGGYENYSVLWEIGSHGEEDFAALEINDLFDKVPVGPSFAAVLRTKGEITATLIEDFDGRDIYKTKLICTLKALR